MQSAEKQPQANGGKFRLQATTKITRIGMPQSATLWQMATAFRRKLNGNGAGTGTEAYQAALQAQARLRALTAVYAVALGTAVTTSRRLPTGAVASRTAAATSMASALFVLQNNILHHVLAYTRQTG